MTRSRLLLCGTAPVTWGCSRCWWPAAAAGAAAAAGLGGRWGGLCLSSVGREQCTLQTGAGCGWCGTLWVQGVTEEGFCCWTGHIKVSSAHGEADACTAQQHQRTREMPGQGAAAAAEAAAATWTVFWGAGSTGLGRVLCLHGVVVSVGATCGLRQWCTGLVPTQHARADPQLGWL